MIVCLPLPFCPAVGVSMLEYSVEREIDNLLAQVRPE